MFSSKDPHHLHQLRVASRRLRNALDVFEDVLPRREIKGWKRTVKKLGKVLSAARDLDVQVQFLHKMLDQQTSKSDQHFFAHLAEIFLSERQRYQPQIFKALNQIRASGTLAELEQDLDRQAHQSVQPFSLIYEIAHTKISQRINKLLAHEKYVNQPRAVHNLHELRIANKQLRYTLETLRTIYSYDIETYLKQILFTHRILGKMHDFDIWIRFLNHPPPMSIPRTRSTPVLKKFRTYCQDQRTECYNTFRVAWHHARANRLFEDLLSYIMSAAMYPPLERTRE